MVTRRLLLLGLVLLSVVMLSGYAHAVELNYWIEKNPDGTPWLVWVKIPYVPVGVTKIYVMPNAAYAPAEPSGVFYFWDSAETWSGWTIYDYWGQGGAVEQNNYRAYYGTYSIKKYGDNDPSGGYKSIGTVGRDVAVGAWVFRDTTLTTGGALDRFGLIDIDGNGYGVVGSSVGTPSFSVERRVDYVGHPYVGVDINSEFNMSWYYMQMAIYSNGELNGYIHIPSLGVDKWDVNYDNNIAEFNYVYVFGGYTYFVDGLRVWFTVPHKISVINQGAYYEIDVNAQAEGNNITIAIPASLIDVNSLTEGLYVSLTPPSGVGVSITHTPTSVSALALDPENNVTSITVDYNAAMAKSAVTVTYWRVYDGNTGATIEEGNTDVNYITFSRTYTAVGDYNTCVFVEAIDDQNNEYNATACDVVHIDEYPQHLTIDFNQYIPFAGETVELEGNATDNGTLTYSWTIGTTELNGQSVPLTEGAAGEYNVVLTVTDNVGLSKTTWKLLRYYPPPNVALTPASFYVRQQVSAEVNTPLTVTSARWKANFAEYNGEAIAPTVTWLHYGRDWNNVYGALNYGTYNADTNVIYELNVVSTQLAPIVRKWVMAIQDENTIAATVTYGIVMKDLNGTVCFAKSGSFTVAASSSYVQTIEIAPSDWNCGYDTNQVTVIAWYYLPIKALRPYAVPTKYVVGGTATALGVITKMNYNFELHGRWYLINVSAMAPISVNATLTDGTYDRNVTLTQYVEPKPIQLTISAKYESDLSDFNVLKTDQNKLNISITTLHGETVDGAITKVGGTFITLLDDFPYHVRAWFFAGGQDIFRSYYYTVKKYTDDLTMYLPNVWKYSTVLVTFYLDDQTGQFTNPILIISRYSSGKTIVVDSDMKDAEGKIPVYLLAGTQYSISVWQNGVERSMGVYVPTQSTSVTLRIGTYVAKPSAPIGQCTYLGVDFNTDTNTMRIDLNSCEYVTAEITVTSADGNTIFATTFLTTKSATATVYHVNPYGDYLVKVKLYVNNELVNTIQRWVSPFHRFALGFPSDWYPIIAIGLILAILLLSGAEFGWFGALIAVLLAGLFTYWGWMSVNVVLLALLGAIVLLGRRTS